MDRRRLNPPTPRARRLRVLFAIGGLQPGGTERQLVELLIRIHPKDVEATLLTWEPAADSPQLRRLLDAGVRHEALGPLPATSVHRRPLVISRLGRIFRSFRPDVAYPWLEQASVVVAPVARMHGVPVVVGRRNISGASIERRPLAALAIRRAERLAAVVTANSHSVVEAAVRRGIAPDRLRLVPNGHAEQLPLPPPQNGDVVALGYVANFRSEKGHLRLLNALKDLDGNHRWRVDLAGGGTLEETIRREVERLELAQHVRFLGQIADIRGFWAQRAVCVLLSDHEGSPNALIEGAFCARPLVGTDVGGIPEVIEPSGGFVVPHDDRRAITGAFKRLIESEELRRELGQGAYEQARRRFGMAAFVEGHLNAINEAVATR